MAFGIFEAAVTSDQEVGLAKQASVDKLAAATYDVREQLGPALFASRSIEEFRTRVAMMKRDQSVYRIIDAHLHPSSGIVRRIVGKGGTLEKEFKARLAGAAQGDESEDNFEDRTTITDKQKEGVAEGDPNKIKDVETNSGDGSDADGDDDSKDRERAYPDSPTRDDDKKEAALIARMAADSTYTPGPGLPPSANDAPGNTQNTPGLISPIPGGGGGTTNTAPMTPARADSIPVEAALIARMASPGLAPETPRLPPSPFGTGTTYDDTSGNSSYMEIPEPGLPPSPYGQGYTHHGANEDPHREVLETSETFKPKKDRPELKPKGNWSGYLDSVDQDAPAKVKKNFASRQAWNLYTDWCSVYGKSPLRLSSLDIYAENLPDAEYTRLANTISSWEGEHHPKVPNTNLGKTDKVAGQHSNPWNTAPGARHVAGPECHGKGRPG